MVELSQFRAPLAVSLGAIAGACCRYYGGQWIGEMVNLSFPIGTFAVNVSGCFLMGLVITLAAKQWFPHPDYVLLITTGFLGSFTTFSAYELDTLNLLDANRGTEALIYWLGSPLLGMMSFSLGILLARAIAHHRSS
ncbi:MAG: fluoride efflux transporter CrcB [Leptolyngbyaceae bacterium]|nr:fluoride efflux transporter CrcB [Leptolyngbyaceae bacterium]